MSKVNVEYDLTPAMVEGAIQNKLIEMGWTPPKPKQKVINLDEMVGSDIDMEFSNFASSIDDDDSERLWYTSQLINIHHNGNYMYPNGCAERCRIRQDHPHANIWPECPLPEGLKVGVYYKDGGVSGIITNYLDVNWRDVSRFYVYCPADGWKYEWQLKQSEDND